jgi:hypothetical protein
MARDSKSLSAESKQRSSFIGVIASELATRLQPLGLKCFAGRTPAGCAGPEWLVDFCALAYDPDDDRFMARADIVGEVEWGDNSHVDEDFEKLFIADAPVLFMTFNNPSAEEGSKVLDRLEAVARKRLQSDPVPSLSCGQTARVSSIGLFVHNEPEPRPHSPPGAAGMSERQRKTRSADGARDGRPDVGRGSMADSRGDLALVSGADHRARWHPPGSAAAPTPCAASTARGVARSLKFWGPPAIHPARKDPPASLSLPLSLAAPPRRHAKLAVRATAGRNGGKSPSCPRERRCPAPPCRASPDGPPARPGHGRGVARASVSGRGRSSPPARPVDVAFAAAPTAPSDRGAGGAGGSCARSQEGSGGSVRASDLLD